MTTQPPGASEREAAYDQIDRFLRNNLDDDDYATFSAALDSIYWLSGITC